MKELQLTIFVNVGLLSVAKIFLLHVVSAEATLPNRCPKETPYPFRNSTFCCSRPVDFQWQKDGYCYGNSQKCTHTEGCVNYHPLCPDIESLLAIDFPLDEYNKIYKPTLIPTRDFSHKLIFEEDSEEDSEEYSDEYSEEDSEEYSEEDSEEYPEEDSEEDSKEDYEEDSEEDSKNHCIWRDDVGKWILGLCRNIESNIGHYYLDADSECPVTDDGWKDIENDQSVDGKIISPNKRLSLGSRSRKSPTSGIKFVRGKRRRRQKVRKCLDWKKIPLINTWRCFKFFPRRKKPKGIKKGSKCKVKGNSGNIECGSQDRSRIKDKELGNRNNLDEFNLFSGGDKKKNDFVDKQKENTVDTDDQELDYSIDSILYDI